MSAAVAVLAAALLPSPYDLIHADSLLHQPPDTPAGVGSPPLVRAVLSRMLALDAVDPGCLYQWFGPHPFQTELDHARRLVARVATCPPLSADTLPPGAWFAAEAGRIRAAAGRRGGSGAGRPSTGRRPCGRTGGVTGWRPRPGGWRGSRTGCTTRRPATTGGRGGRGSGPGGWCSPRRTGRGGGDIHDRPREPGSHPVSLLPAVPAAPGLQPRAAPPPGPAQDQAAGESRPLTPSLPARRPGAGSGAAEAPDKESRP